MNMDKTGRTEYSRLFLLEDLPAPLTRSSAHIQIFDNYLTNSRIRLRSVRVPESNQWNHILQQRIFPKPETLAEMRISEIFLNEAEYEHFKIFEGREIRKNRYFHEFDARLLAFDVYLGPLWGLNRMRVEFESTEEMEEYNPPPFVAFEVTAEPFFDDQNLVEKGFEDVRQVVSRLSFQRDGAEEFCTSE
jgi:CYTH domain-containing protein